MRFTLLCFLISSIVISCKPIGEKSAGSCETVTMKQDGTQNDKAKVKLVKTVVFDTTAILIHGHIKNLQTGVAVKDALITIYNGKESYTETTNVKGDFEIFKNSPGGQWI